MSQEYWGIPDPDDRDQTVDNQECVVDYVRIWNGEG